LKTIVENENHVSWLPFNVPFQHKWPVAMPEMRETT